jgi:hypothetical protein
LVLPKLNPDSRARFVGQLSTLLASLEHMNGGNGGPQGGTSQSYDRRSGNRSGNRGATDRALAMDAAAAKREMQARDFARRWPEIARIKTENYTRG